MSFGIELRTGDVSKEHRGIRSLTMEAQPSVGVVRLCLDEKEGLVPIAEWQYLLDQVSTRRLHEWQSANYPGPMGTYLKEVVTSITSTAAYQLFLIAFEVARLLGFLRHDWDHLFRLGPVLSDISTSLPRLGGLYFAPDEWFQAQSPQVLDELMANNQIVRFTARSENCSKVENVLIPYSTAIIRIGKLTPAATKAWEELREFNARMTGRM